MAERAPRPGEWVFVLGGARSGKSQFAERLARTAGAPVVYLATAEVLDEEMRQRVDWHRQRRPAGWQTVESPRALTRPLREQAPGGATIVIDCLSIFCSNLLLSEPGGGATPEDLAAAVRVAEAEIASLAATARERGWSVIAVSNEVGNGVVPAYALGRTYRDLLGLVNQRAAALAARTYLVVAGIPVDLKRLAATLGDSDDD